MRMPAAGLASPRYSWSTPAMIRKSVLLPVPLCPSTPILAPGRKARVRFLRTSLFGGWTLRTPTIV